MISPCFILARKGSKGLKNKNTRKLNGKPLISYTIEHAIDSEVVSHVCVSTDDPKVAKIANNYGCYTIFPRPVYLSNDNSKTEPALQHALKKFEKDFGKADICFYLQCTEPLRPKNILKLCADKVLKDNYDSAFAASVVHKNFYYFDEEKLSLLNDKKDLRMPRQKKKLILREDTGIGMASKSEIIRKAIRLGPKSYPIIYDHIGCLIDIHDIKDLKIAEILGRHFN
jgi:CMP-N,N'-diacetyllegionaminic acid synthase